MRNNPTSTDWEPVKRDYATGQFSDSELSAKHNVSREAIVRRRKRDREKDANAWPQDLSEQVRQATQALLAKESLSQAITEGHRVITDVILSAAEVNKQVILGHRKQAQDAREAMEQARATVLALGASAADIREAAMFATAVESLTRTTKTVIELERKSFGIDDAAPAGPTQFDRIERVIIDPQD